MREDGHLVRTANVPGEERCCVAGFNAGVSLLVAPESPLSRSLNFGRELFSVETEFCSIGGWLCSGAIVSNVI
jgi:hypothetical protein